METEHRPILWIFRLMRLPGLCRRCGHGLIQDVFTGFRGPTRIATGNHGRVRMARGEWRAGFWLGEGCRGEVVRKTVHYENL